MITPGSWSVYITETGRWIVRDASPISDNFVAEILFTGGHTHGSQDDNPKAIAGVPDMIAALKQIASTHEYMCDGADSWAACTCKAGVAYAALPDGVEP